jgi:hypothetical protein
MKITLTIMAVVLAMALFTAWLNRFFLRCPYCRKIGSWRYDPAEPSVDEKDEDGVVQSRRQLRICRKCGNRVIDKWSDHGGRTFEKVSA